MANEELLSLETNDPINKLYDLETPELFDRFLNLLLNFTRDLEAQISSFWEYSEDARRIENGFELYLLAIQRRLEIFKSKFREDPSSFELRAFTGEENIYKILIGLYTALIYFKEASNLGHVLKILNRLVSPFSEDSPKTLFSADAVKNITANLDSYNSFGSLNLASKDVFERMIHLVSDDSFEYDTKTILMELFNFHRNSLIPYFVDSPSNVDLLFSSLFNCLHRISYLRTFNEHSSFLKEVSRKYFTLFSQDKSKYREQNISDQYLKKYFMTQLHFLLYILGNLNNIEVKSRFLEGSISLFNRLAYAHLFLGNNEMNLESKFIKTFINPSARLILGILLKIVSSGRSGFHKVLIKPLQIPLINYLTFLVGFIVDEETYNNLRDNLLIGGNESYIYSELLYCIFRVLMLLNIRDLGDQERFIIFESSFIYIQLLLRTKKKLTPNLLSMRSYYSIYTEFQRINSIEDELESIYLEILPDRSLKLLKSLLSIVGILTSASPFNSFQFTEGDLFYKNENYLCSYNTVLTISVALLQIFNTFSKLDIKLLANVIVIYLKVVFNNKGILYSLKEVSVAIARNCVGLVEGFCKNGNKHSELLRNPIHDCIELTKLTYEILGRISQQSNYNWVLLKSNAFSLVTSYEIYVGIPSNDHNIALRSHFEIVRKLLEKNLYNEKIDCYHAICYLIHIYAHSFMIWAEHPRLLSQIGYNYTNSIMPSEKSLALYSNYGLNILRCLTNVIGGILKNSDLKELLGCSPILEHVKYDILPEAIPPLMKLTQVPGRLLIYKKEENLYPDQPRLTITNTLFRVIMCWMHNPELSISAAYKFKDLIDLENVREYVINSRSFIGPFSYELTKTYFQCINLYTVITEIIGKIFTSNSIRSILLTDSFGLWYKNILRFPDYANRNKATEPSKLTLPIHKEIVRRFDDIKKLYESPGSLYLQDHLRLTHNQIIRERAAISLCYCAPGEEQYAHYFLYGENSLSGQESKTIDWYKASTPFGEVLRLLFGKNRVVDDIDNLDHPVPIFTESEIIKQRSAARAIHLNAFLETTRMRRKMKAAMKQLMAQVYSVLNPILKEFTTFMDSESKDIVLFKPDNGNLTHGIIKLPASVVNLMSPVFASFLSGGGKECYTKEIILPYEHYVTLSNLNSRMAQLLERARKRGTKMEINFIGEVNRSQHAFKLKAQFELADLYKIEFLRLSCINNFIRQVFVSVKSRDPANSIFILYYLYVEGDDFPLLQSTPDLSMFLCHSIALFLENFFEPAPLNPLQNFKKTVNLDFTNMNGISHTNGDLSSDVDVSDFDGAEETQDEEEDQAENEEEEEEARIENGNTEEVKHNSRYIDHLNPTLLGRWWSKLYFKKH